MSGLSGKNGFVRAGGTGGTRLAEITSWSFNPTSNNPAWASSDTEGYKTRVAGVKDASGSIEMKFDPNAPPHDNLSVGTLVALVLYVNATNYFVVNAIIDSLTYNVDIDDGEVVSANADYSLAAVSSSFGWENPS